MGNADFKRVELLLEIIADELYVARTDREFEDASLDEIPNQGPTGPAIWFNGGGRDHMIKQIENMRDTLT